MRIAYLECFSGMSGDMFLGALVDAGVSPRLLQDTVAALGVGARLEISRVMRSGISATKVDVWVDGEKDRPREEFWAGQSVVLSPAHSHYDHGHDHEHPHEEEHHSHSHSDSSNSPRAEASAPPVRSHQHGRGLIEIRELIGKAVIGDTVKKTAIAIFEALGAAEARIHATSIEGVHFHEVGAVDAIVDIVCAAVGAEALGVD